MKTSKFIEHQFKSNETINGAIKLYNGHDLTSDEIKELNSIFHLLNDDMVPRVGQTVKIPIK
jgi:hypothetical protein